MALDKEIWLPIVQENLFEGREKLAQIATNDNQYVVTGADGLFHKVYIPQAGEADELVLNPSSYPLTVSERNDDVLEYQLDHLVMPPKRLGRYDAAKLSYDKMTSIIRDKYGRMGEGQLYKSFISWYIGKETAKYVETSGSNVLAHAPAATGNRKALTVADVQNAGLILDLQKIPADNDRFLVLDAAMFWQLYNDIRTGNHNIRIIEKDGLTMLSEPFLGFNIVKFARVAYATTAGVIRQLNQAGATTDIAVGYAYHKKMVSYADGDFHLFDDPNSPIYLGGVMSAETWIGASYRRKDKKGIVPILQAQGA
jgi:hypothetical protein